MLSTWVDVLRSASTSRLAELDGYVERSGVELHYEVYGNGTPTVLLLPRWSIIRSRFWKLQVPFLARHFRVIGQPRDGADVPRVFDRPWRLQVRVDPATGAFERDNDGRPVPVEGLSGLLLRWGEIEYLDFQEID